MVEHGDDQNSWPRVKAGDSPCSQVLENKTSNVNTTVATFSHDSVVEQAEEHQQHLLVRGTRSSERNCWATDLSHVESEGDSPTRFPIDTIHRRYDPEDHQAYTYEEFLYHYAVRRGWPVEAVRTFWEGLPRARDHLLV